ncbi:hypothetical protein PJK45_00315 [Mycobacterium kansasii]|uniref:Uncharacterized protein n=3 Tax=Mycobacterium kansasii TaxID=1768 RepID=A0A653EH04_MYCKA|nr:hypothetical protein [Mycobacterium kansasii]AGZ54345.1 hypothetical protein MKAN_19710 [Mycobacterium kansasii ATCC 12478]UCA17940.1 hypothetical protein LA359_16825 [Mycobacterium kansasii]UGT82798.1 hypothetical protein LTS70_08875 [Mycobacterium kansasii]UGT87076.1 hypothetical protein LTT71_02275 [Mycobacterium kansasii]UGU24660.1 hypothetical protein LT351_25215 [Mycobacterium kansasii]
MGRVESRMRTTHVATPGSALLFPSLSAPGAELPPPVWVALEFGSELAVP